MIAVDLSGKLAVVTGASQGLGARTAATLAEAGAGVVLNYFDDPAGTNRKRAEQVRSEIGSSASLAEADVRDRDAVADMFDRIERGRGPLSIVVNNAAIIRDKTIKKMSDREWDDVIDTNLKGTFNICREAAERLADEGRIVNISSISALMGFFGQTNYAAAKAGVIGLTKSLSRELAGRSITVNAVAPGVVLTEMGRSIPEKVRASMLQSIPLGRFGEPSEIASVILFLASDLASYVTGQVIQVNGGWIG